MTDDKKHDDKDRKKLSDEEMEDVAGGEGDNLRGSVTVNIVNPKKKGDDTSVTGMGLDGDDIKKKSDRKG